MASSKALHIDKSDGILTLTNCDAPINRMSFEYMDALEAAVDVRFMVTLPYYCRKR